MEQKSSSPCGSRGYLERLISAELYAADYAGHPDALPMPFCLPLLWNLGDWNDRFNRNSAGISSQVPHPCLAVVMLTLSVAVSGCCCSGVRGRKLSAIKLSLEIA